MPVPDIINLLPDNIANQIAAGEVIQRPASAVKELLENAVDSGATEIKLLVVESGKALVQVIDNGKGMSETDARMSFERHATSKISNIEDLFRIKTMGFRGEALASIAAVAMVEMKTKTPDSPTGVYIEIENSQVKKQEPVAMQEGTSISMKNLFFNVPARRNFLKSDSVEMRHIVDEFTRVTLSFPHIHFSLYSNNALSFNLEAGSLKQRIIQLMGNQYESKLVPIKENTHYLNIQGFTGKPETAKKTRGDQYFFVNNRFIKSAYLNHAVQSAYSQLIAPQSFPMYVLFIDIDPQQVDVNVHPTKQEIKFEDEQIIYAFVQSAVKHALAQYSIMPSLEFDLDVNIQKLDSVQKPSSQSEVQRAVQGGLSKDFSQKNQAHFIKPTVQSTPSDWNNYYAPLQSKTTENTPLPEPIEPLIQPSTNRFVLEEGATLFQVLNEYIVVQGENRFFIVHQQAAHERVLYNQYMKATNTSPIGSQQSLFPETIELSPGDSIILNEFIPDLLLMGFLIEPFGKNTFLLQGTPAEQELTNSLQSIEDLLENIKHFRSDHRTTSREKLLQTMAKHQAVKAKIRLTEREMRYLVGELFGGEQMHLTPDGKPILFEADATFLAKIFGRG